MSPRVEPLAIGRKSHAGSISVFSNRTSDFSQSGCHRNRRGSRADRILSLLDQVRPCGEDSWRALCPNHDDHNPSLSIRGTRDRLLLHCWAGCLVSDICSSIGITVADLFNDSHRHSNPDPERERRRRAAENLERWRQTETVRLAEELRTRDIVIRQIDRCVAEGFITEDEAADWLEYEYRGYSELEYKLDQLIRNENTLRLWRESRRAI